MKKKLSLLLVLCLLAGLMTPAADVRAAGISDEDTQAVETAMEEPVSEESENREEADNASDTPAEKLPAEELPEEELPAEEPEVVEEITEEAVVSAEEQATELTTNFSEYGADNWSVAVTDSYSYGVELLLAYRGDNLPWYSGILITESAANVDLTKYMDGTKEYMTPADVEDSILVDTVSVQGTTREVQVRFLSFAKSATDPYRNYKGNYYNSVEVIKAAVNGLEPDTSYDWVMVSQNDYSFVPALGEGETAVQRSFSTAETPEGSTEPSAAVTSLINGYTRGEATVKVSGLNGQRMLRHGLNLSGDKSIDNYSLETEVVTDTEHVLPDWNSSWGTLSYYDWTEEGSTFDFSYDETTSISPFAEVEVWTPNGYEKKIFTGALQGVTGKSLSGLSVEEESTEYMSENYVSRIVKLAPVDREKDIQVGFYYKKTTDTDWTESSNAWNTILEDGVLSLWFDIFDLEAETEYQLQYRVYAYDDYWKSNVLCTLNGGSFTTSSVLTQEDIPDPVLWKAISGGAESISSAELEARADLYVSTYDGAVKDLTGIGYLKNLTSIELREHAVSDVTPLLECKKLESINLACNELTYMPDFSGLTSLTELNLNYNLIPEKEITEDKYPAGTSVSVKYQRKEPLAFSLSDSHIYKDTVKSDTYGVQIQLKNVKSDPSSLQLKITDKTDKDNEVILYNLSSIPFKQTSSNSIYSISAVVTGIRAEAGERIWEFTYEVCGQTLTSEVAVTVDPDGVGGIQVMPESILPLDIKNYLLARYTSYDTNEDDEFSFAEIAAIPSLYMYGYSLAPTDFSFLQYMKGLHTLNLSQQTGFTQKQLDYVTGLTELRELNLSWTSITDLTPLASLTKLETLNLSGISRLTGLEALKGLTELTWIGADSGVFSDAEIFDFICSTTEKTLAVGEKKRLVGTAFYLSDESKVTVSCSAEGIVGFADGKPFEAYGMRKGETNVTYTYGGISRTIPVTVTAAEWDYDPALGPVVEDADRMHFTGTEGLLNARASRSMEDENGNIWSISTRTPEKLLSQNEYTKYAARLLYNRTSRFAVETTSPGYDLSMYLDSEGTLWSYTENTYYSSNNFAKRYEIMTNVADWQEGGYYDEPYCYSTQTIQILRKDGSLWLWYFNTYYENGVRYAKPGKLEKIEDSGVVAVYPNSYLTEDGGFYRIGYQGDSKLVAKNVVRVIDNTAIALAQDATGNYYSTGGKVQVSGTVKEMVVGSYFNPDYVKLSSDGYWWTKTGKDMIASYLLMNNGTLYRSRNSDSINSVNFEVLDTGVTTLTKDYYQKGSTVYAFTGQTYESYLGTGIGKGLYPIVEEDGTTTLYVNGVPYLTKVADWTVGDSCIYAIRLDNTLWQFNDENKPQQVNMGSLDAESKKSPKILKEIDITDLKKDAASLKISWTPIEGAVCYQLDTAPEADSVNWAVTELKDTSYSFSGLKAGDNCYFRIRALNSAGEECGRSWKYYCYHPEIKPETTDLDFVLTYGEQKISPVLSEESETRYQMDYDASMKGKVLMLETTTVGNNEAKLKATSSNTSVVTASLSGHTIKLTVKGTGTARITVQALDTKLTETVTLSIRDYTPRLDVTSVSLNKLLTTKAVAAVYPVYGTVLENISIDETKLTAKELKADYTKYFAADLTEAGIRITLDETDKTPLQNGSYRLPLTVTVWEDAESSISGEDEIRELPLVLTVKLTSTKPKITAKQTEKINLFYKDTKAVYYLNTSAGVIQDAMIIEASGTEKYFESEYEDGVLTLTPKVADDGSMLIKDLSSKELSAVLKVRLAVWVGEEDEMGSFLIQNLTIGKDTAKPSVTLTSTEGKVYKYTEVVDGIKETYYTGTNLTFQPINKKTKEVFENVEVKLTGYEVTKKGVATPTFSAGDGVEKETDESYLLEADDKTGKYTIYFIGDATATATLTVQGENWAEPVKVTYKATVTTSAITGKLSTSSVSLNKNYKGDQKTLTLTTNLPYTEFELGDWTVTPPKKVIYDGGLVLEKSADGKGLTVRLDEANKEGLAKGTYKISIPLTFTFEDGVTFTPKALSLTVNVLEEDLTSKCVKWKTSGKPDVLDRAGSGITAAPTISKLNAVLEAAELSEADKEAGLDEKLTVAVEDGKLKIQLIEGVDISTKEKYVIHPILTLKTESGEEHEIPVAPAITVQPTQSATKITLGAQSLTMYGAAYGTQKQTVNYTLKGASGAAVERVESLTAGFEAELLEDGKIEIRLTNSALAAKTYTVKMNVYLTDQAVNQKPVSVSIKVVLKK